MSATLPIVVAALALLSIAISPKAKSNEGFFSGFSPQGQAPSLFTLVLSQVTTWIFARSLLNAAILGFYYGIWGTIAYAAYYLSFLTGAAIVDSIRFKHGFNSVQSFLEDRFGKLGTHCYNFVVGLRLISEVFANILVIGILFGAAGTSSYTIAVVAFAAIAMIYSMLGGLHASLKTDVMQMLIFIAVLALLVVSALGDGLYSVEALNFVEFDVTNPGPILLAVALLQVWSYPLHDPVMMDRGFIADRDTTKRSFLHAAWISILCIIAFGSLGIIAGANALDGDSMNVTLERILGDNMMLLFNIALVVSALSTLDSTLSSSAKLVVIDMK
ncbi:sodium:proline symporter, partial [Oleiphilus sp. HI0009]